MPRSYSRPHVECVVRVNNDRCSCHWVKRPQWRYGDAVRCAPTKALRHHWRYHTSPTPVAVTRASRFFRHCKYAHHCNVTETVFNTDRRYSFTPIETPYFYTLDHTIYFHRSRHDFKAPIGFEIYIIYIYMRFFPLSWSPVAFARLTYPETKLLTTILDTAAFTSKNLELLELFNQNINCLSLCQKIQRVWKPKKSSLRPQAVFVLSLLPHFWRRWHDNYFLWKLLEIDRTEFFALIANLISPVQNLVG